MNVIHWKSSGEPLRRLKNVFHVSALIGLCSQTKRPQMNLKRFLPQFLKASVLCALLFL